MARRPSDTSASRRRAARAAHAARVAGQLEHLRAHLRRVSAESGSPIEAPPGLRVVELFEILEAIGVEPGDFFAGLIQRWSAEARPRPGDGGEDDEM